MAASSFRGTHEPKLDAKGRLSIPSEFRRVLASGMDGEDGAPMLVLVHPPRMAGRIQAFSLTGMAAKEAEIAAMPAGMPRTLATMHYTQNSTTLTLDETGRIVLPKALRERIGLPSGGTVRMLGQLERFEIWSADRHEAERAAELSALMDALPEAFDMDELIQNPGMLG